MCRFGVPHTIITDNGQQFIDRGLQSFYEDLDIKSIMSSVEHPQTNGQVETANKVILNELKKRLNTTKDRWTEEPLEAHWAYRCTTQTSTQGDTLQPNLRHRGHDTGRGRTFSQKTTFDLSLNQESLSIGLDLLNELQDNSKIRETTCKL